MMGEPPCQLRRYSSIRKLNNKPDRKGVFLIYCLQPIFKLRLHILRKSSKYFSRLLHLDNSIIVLTITRFLRRNNLWVDLRHPDPLTCRRVPDGLDDFLAILCFCLCCDHLLEAPIRCLRNADGLGGDDKIQRPAALIIGHSDLAVLADGLQKPLVGLPANHLLHFGGDVHPDIHLRWRGDGVSVGAGVGVAAVVGAGGMRSAPEQAVSKVSRSRRARRLMGSPPFVGGDYINLWKTASSCPTKNFADRRSAIQEQLSRKKPYKGKTSALVFVPRRR